MIDPARVLAATLKLMPELEGDRDALRDLGLSLVGTQSEQAIAVWALGVASALCRVRGLTAAQESE